MPCTSGRSTSAVAHRLRKASREGSHTELERVDDLPIILAVAQKVGIPDAIDEAITKIHGNRTGLSYGRLALGMIGAIGMRCDHRVRPIEEWSVMHRHTLEAAMGIAMGEKDFTDDRLADLLWVLGDPEGQVQDTIEEKVGQRMVRAYRLPSELGRADTTSVSVYHDRDNEEGLLRYGKSKNHRPDLRQFVQLLGTLDPAGIPLTTSTLPGNRADDTTYWPTWQRMERIIGRSDWLFVGDSKLHSAENLARIHRAEGYFLTPIPMKGNVPDEFAEWLKSAPNKLTPVRLPDAKGEMKVVGHGFEVEREIAWTDPETGEEVKVTERVFVVRRNSFQKKQIHTFRERLEKAEEELQAKDGQRVVENREEFEEALREIVERRGVAEFLSVKVTWKSEQEEKWVGAGRPGPNRQKRVIEHTRVRVSVRRRESAIAKFEQQAGWRAYGTNAPKSRLSLQQAVENYAGQWQPERGFHRIKGGVLKVAPIFLRTDRHICGLMLIVTMVLRLLTLIEFVVRRNLAAAKESLTGLYKWAPKKATARPTVEILLEAFEGVTLQTVRTGKHVQRQLIGLTALHKRILKYTELPMGTYAALESG